MNGDVLQGGPRGGKVVFQCDPALRRLVQDLPGMTRWLPPSQTMPPCDVHSPLLSPARVFDSTPRSVPWSGQYVHADRQGTRWWRREMTSDGPDLKVGLVWAGSAMHPKDRHRSLSLSVLAPLSRVKDVLFYSLQKGKAAVQACARSAGLEMIDRTQHLSDFADTAALIANLDLVVSVDTSVVHLAGAMGKPVWTMLPFVPDWRWLLDREDTPWYPSMRLFRQPSRGDWSSVVERVADELCRLIKDRA